MIGASVHTRSRRGAGVYGSDSGTRQCCGGSLPPSAGGRNVGFTIGPYFYVVGVGWQGGAKNAVSLTALRAAALTLYHRVSTG